MKRLMMTVACLFSLASLALMFAAGAVEYDNISHVCSNSAAEADVSSHFAGKNDHDGVLTVKLIDWLRDNGAYINDKLVIKQLDLSSPRGIYALEDMEEGETVCKIPWALILKPGAEELAVAYDESSDCGTIESVFRAITAENDDITPYGEYLLNQPKAYTAAFWSQAARDLLQDMLQTKKEQHLTELDALPPHGVNELLEDEIALRCNGQVNNALYRHAAMLVKSRADYQFMVPFYDMMNHHNRFVNVAHRYNPYSGVGSNHIEQMGYEIVATEATKASKQLYLSYNHGNICSEYVDWFGTPEIFLQYGFVEPLPQRWLFDFARVKFDLYYKDANESTSELAVTFLVPPSEKGMALLQEELDRLESFSLMQRSMDYESAGIASNEWQSLWQYFDALHDALVYALQHSKRVQLTDDVWKLDDNWWVQDGTLSAAKVNDHFVYPTKKT